jgi:hypothetical protein
MMMPRELARGADAPQHVMLTSIPLVALPS